MCRVYVGCMCREDAGCMCRMSVGCMCVCWVGVHVCLLGFRVGHMQGVGVVLDVCVYVGLMCRV